MRTTDKDNAMIELLNMAAIKKVAEGISFDRLKQICEAEKDGRCVVLPFKIGGVVYCITSPYNITVDEEDFGKLNQVYECVVKSISLYHTGSIQLRLYYKGEFVGHYFLISDFGKTVFLTKEQAEQALGERKGIE